MNILKEIAALRKLTVKELRKRHVDLFGEENHSANRQYLFRRIAWRLQAVVEGDLSERARRRAQELARDADLRSRPPKELTMPTAPADLKTVTGKLVLSRNERVPMPGTVLRRIFKGHAYHVTVLPNGFEYDGQPVHLVNTDPPYNVKVEPRSNNAIAAGLSSFGSPDSLTHHQGFDLARRPEIAKATHAKLRPKDRPLANDFVSDEEFDRLSPRLWRKGA